MQILCQYRECLRNQPGQRLIIRKVLDNWNLEIMVFEKRGKPEYPEKNLSEQGREPTTNSTHI